MSQRWSIHVPLLPGELFSAWLARTALAQGCDPLILTGAVWPKWRAWTVDIDRGLSQPRLAVLSARAGIGVARLEESTLRPLIRAIAPATTAADSMWPWVLGLGARNRRRRHGLQFCPECLAQDAEPYFRRVWRLAWHVGCESHRSLLSDHCDRCGLPVQPHRCVAKVGSVALCPFCGRDLRLAATGRVANDLLAFQESADRTAAEGFGLWAGSEIPCVEWFARAWRQCAGALRMEPHDDVPLALTGFAMTLAGPSERSVRLRMAYRAMTGLRTGRLMTRARRQPSAAASIGDAKVGSGGNPPVPRPRQRVRGDWERFLRRVGFGQP